MIRQWLSALSTLSVLASCGGGSERVATQKTASSSVATVPGPPVEQGVPTNAADSDESDDWPIIFADEWDPGRTDEAQPRTRFRAREDQVARDAIMLRLDTAIGPVGQPRATKYASADSVRVAGMRSGELFTSHCFVTGSNVIGQIGGVSSVGTPEHFEHPRLAWRFDTVSKRIRVMPADSVYCTITEPD